MIGRARSLYQPESSSPTLSLSKQSVTDDDKWEREFGELNVITATSFKEFVTKQNLLQLTEKEDDQIILKYLFDRFDSGYVQKHVYKAFYKSFGDTSARNLRVIFNQEWFYGHLSSTEAELLLAGQAVGKFLVRLEKSVADDAVGWLTISFVAKESKVSHWIIFRNDKGFNAHITVNVRSERSFPDIFDLMSFYPTILCRSLETTIPLHSWWKGDISKSKAEQLLKGKPDGTYLLRTSSKSGNYAISFVYDGEFKHILAEQFVDSSGSQLFKLQNESSYSSLSWLIAEHRYIFKYALSIPEITLGAIKTQSMREGFVATQTNIVDSLEQEGSEPNTSLFTSGAIENSSDSTGASRSPAVTLSDHRLSKSSSENELQEEFIGYFNPFEPYEEQKDTINESDQSNSGSDEARVAFQEPQESPRQSRMHSKSISNTSPNADVPKALKKMALITRLKSQRFPPLPSLLKGSDSFDDKSQKRKSLGVWKKSDSGLASLPTTSGSFLETELEEPLEGDEPPLTKLLLVGKKASDKHAILYPSKLRIHPHTFSLCTTWIERSPLTDPRAFQIVSPERKIVVLANDENEKEVFLDAVVNQIMKSLRIEGFHYSEDLLKRSARHRFLTGVYYEGEWEKGEFHGQGQLLTVEGCKYLGTFYLGKKEGHGIHVDPSTGARYEGKWKNNLRDGMGVQDYGEHPEWKRYEGMWVADKKHGEGTLYKKDKTALFGVWHMDEPARIEICKPVKCSITGDKCTDKSKILFHYEYGYDITSTRENPSISDVHTTWTKVQSFSGAFVSLTLIDMSALDTYKTAYDTNCFIVCYSVAEPESYKNLQAIWLPEIRRTNSSAPFILVGVRNGSESSRLISYTQGIIAAKQFGAVKYIECDAITGEGVKQVFHEAVKTGLNPPSLDVIAEAALALMEDSRSTIESITLDNIISYSIRRGFIQRVETAVVKADKLKEIAIEELHNLDLCLKIISGTKSVVSLAIGKIGEEWNDKMCQTLYQFLQTNYTLKQLTLDGAIPVTGVSIIFAAFRGNHSIQTLRLSTNVKSNGPLKVLVESLQHNFLLRAVDCVFSINWSSVLDLLKENELFEEKAKKWIDDGLEKQLATLIPTNQIHSMSPMDIGSLVVACIYSGKGDCLRFLNATKRVKWQQPLFRKMKPVDIAFRTRHFKEVVAILEMEPSCAITDAESITHLDLSGSEIDFRGLRLLLPKFPCIESLDLSYLNLESLPPEVGKLELLNTLILTGNPLSTIPAEIRSRDTKGLLNYLKAMDKTSVINESKVMVIGQENVGKTSFVECMKRGDNKIKSKERVVTNGVTVSQVQTKVGLLSLSKGFRFNVYDFAGQEVFYPTHEFFLTARAIYFVVVNMVDYDPSRLDYWVRKVKLMTKNDPNTPIVIIGTHLDEYNQRQDKHEIHAKINDHIVELKVNGYNIVNFFGVSCTSGDGMSELKEWLVNYAQSKFSMQLPVSYTNLAEVIQSKKTQKQIVTWTEFCQWAKGCRISDDDLHDAAQFLHDVGLLIHFREQELDDFVVLDPQLLADAMAAIVGLNKTWINGEAKLDEIYQSWSKYPRTTQESLLKLLTKFEVLMELRDMTTILIPSKLPEHIPTTKQLIDFDGNWKSNLLSTHYQIGRIYEPKFVPLGFFPRLILRMHYHFPRMEVIAIWRSGLLFKELVNKDYHELVYLNFDPKKFVLEITIRIPNNNSSTTMSRVVVVVDTLFENYYINDMNKGLDKLIPCSCSMCVKEKKIRKIFSYDDVVDALAVNAKEVVYCAGKQIAIDMLAPDLSMINTPIIPKDQLELKEIIGQGGFAKVYRGVLKGGEADTEVAVKELLLRSGDSESRSHTFHNFTREADMMASFNHPNVIKLIGTRRCPTQMVFELAPLGDLQHSFHKDDDVTIPMKNELKRIEAEMETHKAHISALGTIDNDTKRQRQSELLKEMSRLGQLLSMSRFEFHQYRKELDRSISNRLRLKVALDIAKALRYLHSQVPPIVHRDVRSPNIFLFSMDENAAINAKLGDFGLARAASPHLTEMLPTWQWLAPEVIDKKSCQYDHRSDIYSFGIVCWELVSYLSGPPFDEYHLPEATLRQQIIHNNLRPKIPDTCDPTLQRLIESCWHKDPAARPSFASICKILLNVLDIKDDADLPRPRSEIMRIPAFLRERRYMEVDAFDLINSIKFKLGASGDGNKPFSIVHFNDVVWIGLGDGNIHVYNTKTHFLDHSLQSTTSSRYSRVYSLINVEDTIWSCDEGGHIKSWSQHLSVKEITRPSNYHWRRLLYVKDTSLVWALGTVKASSTTPAKPVISFWDPLTGIQTEHYIELPEQMNCMVETANHVWLGGFRSIAIVSKKDLQIIEIWKAHSAKISAMVCHSDTNHVWVASEDGHISVWDPNTFDLITSFQVTTGRLYSLRALPHCVISGSAGTLSFWHPKTFELTKEKKSAHADVIHDILVVNESFIWTTSFDGSCSIWSISFKHGSSVFK